MASSDTSSVLLRMQNEEKRSLAPDRAKTKKNSAHQADKIDDFLV